MLAHVFDRLAMQVRRAKDVPRAVGFHHATWRGGAWATTVCSSNRGYSMFCGFYRI